MFVRRQTEKCLIENFSFQSGLRNTDLIAKYPEWAKFRSKRVKTSNYTICKKEEIDLSAGSFL